MNRRPATAIDSDDSGSDWDTTVAESPTHPESRPSFPLTVSGIEGEYATVKPKPRSTVRGDDSNATKETLGKSPPTSPSEDNSQSKGPPPITSPPPHLTSFQNALSDYATVQEVAPPDNPARSFEGKGKLYTVPETDNPIAPLASIANWDDSDAEEQVLKELQQNLEREKQRQQQTAVRDRKITLAGGERPAIAADNEGFTHSPSGSRSNESAAEKWARDNEAKLGRSPQSGKGSEPVSGGNQKFSTGLDVNSLAYLKAIGQRADPGLPMLVKTTTGKRAFVYFEEGSLHYLEIEETDTDAVLPGRVDEWEKIYKRVWHEVFAGLRIVTSVFVLFLVEFIAFLTYYILRPLVLDTIGALGNFIVKPLLTILFNGFCQPLFSFLWNISSSFYQAVEPLLRFLGAVCNQVAVVLRAFRLVTIQYHGRARNHAEVDMV